MGPGKTLKHGSYQYGYRLGCREQCCIRARNRWTSNRYVQRVKAGYTPDWVYDTDTVSERLELLMKEYGYTQRQIAKEVGTSTHSIHTWRKRPPRIRRRSADKVMSIPLRKQTRGEKPRSKRPAVGAQRRIHAMFLRGHTEEGISRQSGVSPKTIHGIRVGQQKVITQRTHDAIAAAFNATLLLPEETGYHADVSRRVARENGYLPFGVWDDIDDPDGTPELETDKIGYDDPVLVEAIRRSHTLASRGFVIGEIADTCDIPRRLFHKILHGKKKKLPPDTAKKMHAGCDKLEPLPDPTGKEANATRTIAKKNGWV